MSIRIAALLIATVPLVACQPMEQQSMEQASTPATQMSDGEIRALSETAPASGGNMIRSDSTEDGERIARPATFRSSDDYQPAPMINAQPASPTMQTDRYTIGQQPTGVEQFNREEYLQNYYKKRGWHNN